MKNLFTILLMLFTFASAKAQLVEISDKGVFFEVKSGTTFLNNYQKGEWQTDFNNDKIWLKNVNTDSLGIRISTEGIDIGDIYNDSYYKIPNNAIGFLENRVLRVTSSGSGGLSEWAQISIEYTPTSESDATYEVGTICHDATYFYIKVDASPHVWNRFLKTAW